MTELLLPYTFDRTPEYDPGGNLGEMIRDGQLCLRADAMARYNFAFVSGRHPIGVFAICSDGPGKLTMVRAHNFGETTRDPFTGLDVPCRGLQFDRIQLEIQHVASPVFFIIEFGPTWEPTRKVAFRAREGAAYNCSLPCSDPNLRFEALDLWRLEIIG